MVEQCVAVLLHVDLEEKVQRAVGMMLLNGVDGILEASDGSMMRFIFDRAGRLLCIIEAFGTSVRDLNDELQVFHS